jgi:hypothetical protein
MFQLFALAETVSRLDALFVGQWTEVVPFIAWTSIEDFVACRRGVQLGCAWRAFALSVTSHTGEHWAQFHGDWTRITESEDLEAFFERRVEEMLPSV